MSSGKAELSERLRVLRKERGLTQQDVAAPAYSAAYVSTIEAGRRTPSQDALEHFASRLGVSREELVTGVSPAVEGETVMELQTAWRDLYSGEYATARNHFRSVEQRAERIGRDAIRSRALVGLGRCAEREGQTDEARVHFEDALGACELLFERAEAVAGIARCHQMSGRPRVATHVLETYLLDLRKHDLPDPRALMRTYASLVWPYIELGLLEHAKDVAEQALRLEVQVEDPSERAGMHVNVARVLMNEGRIQDALRSLERAEEIYSDLNWKTEKARALMAKAIVHMTEGDSVRAKHDLGTALETFQEVGFVREEARALNELARLERSLGFFDSAEDLARRAVELLSEMQAKPELALAHRELGLALRTRDPSATARHLRKSIRLYLDCGEGLHAADVHRLLGSFLEDRGDPTGAFNEYKKGLLMIAEELDREH